MKNKEQGNILVCKQNPTPIIRVGSESSRVQARLASIELGSITNKPNFKA